MPDSATYLREVRPDEIRIKALAIGAERCCYITGLLHAIRWLNLAPLDAGKLMADHGVTAEEIANECVGRSNGKKREPH